MKFISKTIFVAFFALMAFQVSAQKFGYVNSASLIEMHPSVKTANAELEAFQKSEADALQAMAATFETKYKKFIADNEAGTLSQVQIAQQQEALTTEQKSLQTAEQQAQFKLAQKREALIQPILQELDGAIQAIGQDEGYMFIFDTSGSGSIIYAEESEDITAQVKLKLGWQ